MTLLSVSGLVLRCFRTPVPDRTLTSRDYPGGDDTARVEGVAVTKARTVLGRASAGNSTPDVKLPWLTGGGSTKSEGVAYEMNQDSLWTRVSWSHLTWMFGIIRIAHLR